MSANKAVEVNEMWRIRQKEMELDNRHKGRSRDENRNDRTRNKDTVSTSRSVSMRLSASDNTGGASCSSSKGVYKKFEANVDEGLKDEEVEEFLHSRFEPFPVSARLYFILVLFPCASIFFFQNEL